ncbi:ICE2-domain-containing protein [Hyphopichia burtonii NRRL Y-1933]|uniref:ICE2-domain-containing protein n=1 Tax=Hyphopichia burtonii NRRL Y-1933 TaxID=984485 RepID=A0A1E4RIF8_9ASCO|nr:ICE2-domain-containing protein [Hyphopichia burtonii NRRL Y-1933]ODV67058.1 ICE2-domain-containing protein [Hyphopichia burtonii NRRL Y-1933]
MNQIKVKIARILEIILSTVYLVLLVLCIPLAFDVGGIACGLAFSFTTFALYFILTTIRLITRRSKYFRWVSILYYLQHILLPSLLTFFLSYYNSSKKVPSFMVIDVWKLFIVNSTPIFTILEGFCSLLLIQAVGQTLHWLTVYKSDSWLIVSLVGSGSTIAASLYFLYRIYVYPFSIDIISASLLGSLLTLTIGLALFGIVSNKGSMIESSLLFAYIVRCIYETFPILSEDASQALTSLFTQTTFNLKDEVPRLPPQLTNTISQLVPFLASNLPGSFKTVWEFFVMAIQKLTLPLLLNLAYRIGVFYAATKIIPSLYHGANYPSLSPPRTPPQVRSRQASTTSISTLNLSPPFNPKEPVESDDPIAEISNDSKIEPLVSTPTSGSPTSLAHKKSSRLNSIKAQKPSTIIRLIYAYSPCIIIAVYTHLMMLYNGELGTELKLWGFWENDGFEIIVHPWQFWNWVNMGTTLLLYTAELSGNSANSGGTALTSHWKIE